MEAGLTVQSEHDESIDGAPGAGEGEGPDVRRSIWDRLGRDRLGRDRLGRDRLGLGRLKMPDPDRLSRLAGPFADPAFRRFLGILTVVAAGAVIADNYFGRDDLAAMSYPAVVDSFDRAAGYQGLDSDGHQWVYVNCAATSWAVTQGQATNTFPGEGGPAMALLGLPAPAVEVSARFPSIQEGSGLVFRFVDPKNYWVVVGSPQFATWSVRRVTDGRIESIADTGQSTLANGVDLSVRFTGDVIEIRVNGGRRLQIKDPVHRGGANTAGLYAEDGRTVRARWDDFVMQLPPQSARAAITPIQFPGAGTGAGGGAGSGGGTGKPGGSTPTSTPAVVTTVAPGPTTAP